VRQLTAANHGSGNPSGLQFDKGDATLANTMAATAVNINGTGTAGHVEFWLGTTSLVSPNGWTFQTSMDGGATWTTRLSELTGSNHAMQLYHYDLTAAERVNTLRLRFQFTGYPAIAPTPAPNTASPQPSTNRSLRARHLSLPPPLRLLPLLSRTLTTPPPCTNWMLNLPAVV
jgi:hypothetical protein